MGVILNGKALSEEILAQVAVEVESLKKNGIAPKLCVILVGDNPASLSYVNMKHRACERTGIISQILKFGEEISQNALLCEIERLNNDKSVNGILVQLPLPKHISTDAVLEAICPTKDVDGFHPYNIGRLVAQSMQSNKNSSLGEGNSSLGMQFRTCGNFGDFADIKSSLNPQNSHKYKSHTANTRIVDLNKSDSSLRGDLHESPKQSTKNGESAESTNKTQQTIEGIAVEVAEFLPNFECETRLEVCERSKFGKSPQDAPKTKLQTSELQIYDLGMIPTPTAYFSLYMDNGVDSSIMITGSHNPPQYNGFKITILKKPFYGEDIRKLGEKITQNTGDSHTLNAKSAQSSAPNPQIQKLNALQKYVDFLTSHFKNLRNFPHKVAFDCGNGVGGIALKSVLDNLNIPHLPLFFEPNGDFPNHHPDPSEDKNLVFLRNAMKEHNIKIGIAFDGDADRIGLLTQNYHFKGDELAILFAKQIAKSGTKPVVIGEVKCSAVMYNEINKMGSAIMYKTGHSNLKVKLSEINAHLAAEMSGHIFFNDRYFGYDDAIYASFRVLELFLDSNIEGVENAIKSLPQMFSTSEEKIDSSENKKFEIIKKLAKKLNEIRQSQSAKNSGDSQNPPQNLMRNLAQDSQNPPQNFPKITDIIDIDGIRVVFENGWGLIRASNTTPVLVTRFEATNRASAELYKRQMLLLLSECEKDLR